MANPFFVETIAYENNLLIVPFRRPQSLAALDQLPVRLRSMALDKSRGASENVIRNAVRGPRCFWRYNVSDRPI